MIPKGMADTEDVVVVLSTFPPNDSAAQIARTLVSEKLCACVNLLPGVRSLFEWDDVIEDQEEQLAIIKTTRARVPALLARLPELHPYEVPEALVLPVSGGLAPYLAWVAAGAKG